MKTDWMKGNVLQAASRSDAITSPSIAGGEVFLFGPSQKPWRCSPRFGAHLLGRSFRDSKFDDATRVTMTALLASI